MRNYVVSVKDSAMQQYMRPFYVPALGAAVRSFSDEVNRKGEDNQMYRHPDDYELWVLAEFDDETGRFSDTEVRVLARGKDVVQA
ncbi:MAG: nonstructural protein [Microvirus sp.]|nr:MAG: nonstructural protein [Microvirus sp.]